jgi:hypothetical protein
MGGLLVPSSMQRIRSFLVERCGMKVKPWASAEETLAALHDTLAARDGCGIFWDSLCVLLENLACDLKTRSETSPEALIDNEVLDSERYARLLDEIRQSLSRQKAEPAAGTATGTFRQLSAALSAPALSLLLFLGGVAVAGCEQSGLKQGNSQPDAAVAADTSPFFFPRDAGPDGVGPLILPPAPDTRPAVFDAVARGPDGASVTIQDIMDSCNVDKSRQEAVLTCLRHLRDSWTTGIAEALAGTPCEYVDDQLSCFASISKPCMTGSFDEFVVGSTEICRPIPIYVGVRFV